MLAGIFEGYDFRKSKGIVERLLESLNIDYSFTPQENEGFSAGKSLNVFANRKEIGKFGIIENSKLIYYEFEVGKLLESIRPRKFTDIPKYPTQVEDITFTLPPNTRIGDVAKLIESNAFVRGYELSGVYKNDTYTFHIWYQDLHKTLTNEDVAKIRKQITSSVKTKFGGTLKG